MNKQTPRLLFIGLILLWAIYTLFPTFKFNFLSEEEKNNLLVDGKLEYLISGFLWFRRSRLFM